MQNQEIRVVLGRHTSAEEEIEKTQERLGGLRGVLGGLAGQIKKVFSKAGSVIVDAMERAGKAVYRTGRALKRTVASFDQINRLKAPPAGGGLSAADKKVLETKEKVTALIQQIQRLSGEGVTKPITDLMGRLDGVTQGIFNAQAPTQGLLDKVWKAAVILGMVNEKTGRFIDFLGTLVPPVFTVTSSLSVLWGTLKKVALSWDGVSGSAGAAFQGMTNAWAAAKDWVTGNVTEPVGGAFRSLWSGITQGSNETNRGMKEIFSDTASSFGTVFSNAWKKIRGEFSSGGEVYAGLESGVLGQFKASVNGLIDGINSVVHVPFNGLNSVLGSVSQMEILGMKPFRWLKWRAPVPKIPHLAEGAVLPANHPFLAVVGDQKSGTNIEAPLSTIEEAVAMVMDEHIKAMMAGFEALLAEQQATRRTIEEIEVGDTVIGQAAGRYQQKLAIMRGGV